MAVKYAPKIITMDLAEYQALVSELESYRQAAGQELSDLELQEATGILVTRAVQNPVAFREGIKTLDLGKYKAIFALRQEEQQEPRLLVKFVRT